MFNQLFVKRSLHIFAGALLCSISLPLVLSFNQYMTFHTYIPEKDAVEVHTLHFIMWGHGYRSSTRSYITDKNHPDYITFKKYYDEEKNHQKKIASMTPEELAEYKKSLGPLARIGFGYSN